MVCHIIDVVNSNIKSFGFWLSESYIKLNTNSVLHVKPWFLGYEELTKLLGIF